MASCVLARFSKLLLSPKQEVSLFHDTGAEQIVGNLASKVLTSQGSFIPVVSTGAAMNSLQALDIFLVQANTNVLVAQFVPLLISLFLQTQIPIEKIGGLKLSDIQTEKDIADKPDQPDLSGLIQNPI